MPERWYSSLTVYTTTGTPPLRQNAGIPVLLCTPQLGHHHCTGTLVFQSYCIHHNWDATTVPERWYSSLTVYTTTGTPPLRQNAGIPVLLYTPQLGHHHCTGTLVFQSYCIHHNWDATTVPECWYSSLTVYTTTGTPPLRQNAGIPVLLYTPQLGHHHCTGTLVFQSYCIHHNWDATTVPERWYSSLTVYTTTGTPPLLQNAGIPVLLCTPPLGHHHCTRTLVFQSCCVHHNWDATTAPERWYSSLTVYTTTGTPPLHRNASIPVLLYTPQLGHHHCAGTLVFQSYCIHHNWDTTTAPER